MKWLIAVIIFMPFYIGAEGVYTADEFETFKYITLIGQEIWNVIKQKEVSCNNYNKELTASLIFMYEMLSKVGTREYRDNISTARNGLKTLIRKRNQQVLDQDLRIKDTDLYNVAFTYYYDTMTQIEDIREHWPCCDTSAEKTFAGFFLEFEECLSMNLWTPWGKLPITKSYIEIEDATVLTYRDKITEALSATKFVYGDKTIYTLHRIIKSGYNGIDLPTAVLTDKPITLGTDFLQKWHAMYEHWQELNPPKKSPEKPINPVPEGVKKESPREKREKLRKTSPKYEKPVLSLMHLTAKF